MKWRVKVKTSVFVPGQPVHTLLAKPYPSKLPLSGGYWMLVNNCENRGEEFCFLEWTANAREVYELSEEKRKEYREKCDSDLSSAEWTEGRLLGLKSDRTIRWKWTSVGEIPPYLLGLKSDRTIRWKWTSVGEIPPYKERGLTDQQINNRRTKSFLDSHFTHYRQARKNWSLGTPLVLPDVPKLLSTPHILADYLEDKCGDACHDWYGFLVALRSTVG